VCCCLVAEELKIRSKAGGTRKGARTGEQRKGGKGQGSGNSLHFLNFAVYEVRIVSKLPLDAIIDLMNPCHIRFQ
jgi:hypothetical protein